MDTVDSIASNIAFTTSGSLVDCVDKKVLVLLRDGRKLLGVLRSYDQFANLLLQDAIERIYLSSQHVYADIPKGSPASSLTTISTPVPVPAPPNPSNAPSAVLPDGSSAPSSSADPAIASANGSLDLFLVRGENVVLIGEVDLDTEDMYSAPPYATPRPLNEVLEAHAKETAAKVKRDAHKARVLKRTHGFCEEGQEGDGY